MHIHYALVDDLLSKIKFERRVEEKIRESGGLIDEQTAAMLVVRDLGREHVSINRLSSTSSLSCFFGKVLAVSSPREFERKDGSMGIVSRILAGDETGEVYVVLWEEGAAAVEEVEAGDVLEIVGRPKPGVSFEVHAVAIRKAACDISTRDAGGSIDRQNNETCMDVCLISKGNVRPYIRRDGSAGDMLEAVIGDDKGAARLVCWHPVLLEPFPQGSYIRIQGFRLQRESPLREYSIGEGAQIHPLDSSVEIPVIDIANAAKTQGATIHGCIKSVSVPQRFATRNGDPSWKREIIISDSSGEIPVLLWGDHALIHLAENEAVEIYNTLPKRGPGGRTELHVGFGGAIRVVCPDETEVEIRGTIIPTRYGCCIDDCERWYILERDLSPGCEVHVRGLLRGKRLTPYSYEAVRADPDTLRDRLMHFIA